MPPNSMMEWVAGRNITKPRRGPRPVFALEVSTDDETDSDTISLTYPRKKHGVQKVKKVRFRTSPNLTLADSTLVDTDVSTTSLDTASGDATTADVDPDSDCPCSKCIVGRRKLKRERQDRRKVESSGTDTTDDEIHTKHKANKEKCNGKGNGAAKEQKPGKRNSSDDESGPTETDGTDGDTSKRKKNNQKQAQGGGSKKDKGQNNEKNQEGTQKKKKGDGKKGGKSKSNTDSDGSEEEDTESPSSASEGREKVKEKKRKGEKGKQPPPAHQPPPQLRPPNLLLPVKAEVLQVEHTLEMPEDPRPNAFYDHEHGIMRVYHGSKYGNPHGTLYPKRGFPVPEYHHSLPAGATLPLPNPYYQGFGTAPYTAPNHPNSYLQDQANTQSQAPPPRANAWFQGYGTTAGNPVHGERSAAQNLPPPGTPLVAGNGNPFACWEPNEALSPTVQRLRAKGKEPLARRDWGPSPDRRSDGSRYSSKADSNRLWGAQGGRSGGRAGDEYRPRTPPGGWGSRVALDELFKKMDAEAAERAKLAEQSAGGGYNGGNEGSGFNNGGGNGRGDNDGWASNNKAGGGDAWNSGGNGGGEGDWGGVDSGTGNCNNNNSGGANNNTGENGGWGADVGNSNNAGFGETSRENNNDNNTWNQGGGQSGGSDYGNNVGPKPTHNEGGNQMPGGWNSPGNHGGPTSGGSGEPPFTAGNVAGNDWGRSSINQGTNGQGNWQDPSAAQNSGGFWDNDGKGTEKVHDGGAPAPSW